MKQGLYATIGQLGALVGVNLAAALIGLGSMLSFVQLNHIGEAVGVLAIVALVSEMFPEWNAFKKLSVFAVPVMAFIIGAVWEPLSFLVGLSPGSPQFIEIEIEWLRYGLPTVFLIGLPVILYIEQIRKRRSIFGINATSMQGHAIAFIGSIIIGAIALWLLIQYNVYAWI